MAGSVKGIIVEIGGDTSNLQKALSKVNSSTASLSKELRGVNSLLKLDPSNTEMLSQKQVVLKKNIEETSNKLEQLKEAQKIADEQIASGTKISDENYRALQREIANTETKLNLLKTEASNWTKAGRSIEEFGNKITNISNKIDKMGTTLTTRLTLPIMAIATSLVSSAKEFETAFTGVEKTVDGTVEQMENLKQGIKEMAEEIPSSTTEIAAVAEAAGQLGIQTDNILSFSKAMIDLGNSTNLTSEEAASQLAKFANVMQMSQKDFDKLGSAIVDLGNNYATTEADIVNMAMRLAGAGKQVGFSEGQVLGLATALSSVGIEAEMGGSAISKAMVKMQNAVEMGGDKLNTVLKKTGLTLRELELMSANDSKGFKDLAQSIGMTSTEVKQLVTAGTNLEDFAAVSGMTAEQFQKAWKEDASGALSSFIKGLGEAEDKGESAITMLSEMGLTEVRLRDSLLRAANAGDLFNNAIETGTKAWEENTALTNEANKRYATLDSRLQITANKIKNVATNTGNKLTPTFNELLDKVDGLIDKFDNLSEEELENIIKTAALVAAIGPAVKILGTLGKGLGTVTKGIGTFSQAIAVAKNNTTSIVPEVNKLANGMKFLVSPAGLVTTAVTALVAGLTYLAIKQANATKETKEFAEEISNQKQDYEEYNKSIDKTTKSNLAQINSVSQLREELKNLVDENGKVKKGYESRVAFILNQLNEALGTEYKLNGDIVQSYKELQSEIDETIEKKKAEILLNASEEKYKNAVEKETEAVAKLKEAHDELGMSIEDAKKKQEELNNKMKDFEKAGDIYNSEYFDTASQKKNLENLIKAYEDSESTVKQCVKDKKSYETDYALFVEGKYDEIGKTIKDTTTEWTNASIKTIRDSIIQEKDNLDKYKKIYKETGTEIAEQQVKQAEQNLNNLANELVSRTSTIEALGLDEISAWKTLATNSYEEYQKALSQMAPEMQQRIQEITGVIASDITVQTEAGNLADRVVSNLNRKNNAIETGKDIIRGLQQGIQDKYLQTELLNSSETLANNMIKKMNLGAGVQSPSKYTRQTGRFVDEGLILGLKDKEKEIINKASQISSSLIKEINQRSKIDFIDTGKFQSSLNKQIVDSSKTIFTTPQIVFNVQELDEARLNQCFNYINKKFGSAY